MPHVLMHVLVAGSTASPARAVREYACSNMTTASPYGPHLCFLLGLPLSFLGSPLLLISTATPAAAAPAVSTSGTKHQLCCRKQRAGVQAEARSVAPLHPHPVFCSFCLPACLARVTLHVTHTHTPDFVRLGLPPCLLLPPLPLSLPLPPLPRVFWGLLIILFKLGGSSSTSSSSSERRH
jgi:hypothetical protein